MRVLVAIAILVLGVAAASAADVDVVQRGHATIRRPLLIRSAGPPGKSVIYDWEPGVVVRAYWLPPWRDRHYFPFGHDRRIVQACMRLGCARGRHRNFQRYWSNASRPSRSRCRARAALPARRSAAAPRAPIDREVKAAA